jgi:branched-chain amino acid transport system ATP-binding protein
MEEGVLKAVDLTRYFGAVRATENLNLSFRPGEIVGIVGTNGSGKTTFLNLITGYLKPDSGHVYFNDRAITGLAPRRITELGIARSFQVPQLYTGLTVSENVLLAIATRSGQSFDFWSPLKRAQWIEEIPELLSRFGLGEHAGQPVHNLPEGHRKVLDVALSYVLKPKLLLMDEPTSGVSMKDKFEVMDALIDALRSAGVTTVFVEHDTEIVERYAERVLAFHDGRVIADGPVKTVLSDAAVREAILGVE